MKSAWLCAWTALAVLAAAPARALPNVAVLASPVASKWLQAAGIQHTVLTPEQAAADGLATVQILVVPADRIQTPALAQAVVGFVRRGGAALVIYWGPVVRDGAESPPPCYGLQEVIGARPVGWRGTGPVTLRFEPNVDRGTLVAETPVGRGILVTLQPQTDAQVLARWTTGGTSPPERDVVILRAGNVVYCGLDLFAPGNDTPPVRQIFLWLFGMVAPNLAFDQAREGTAAAMAGVIKLESQVGLAEMQFPHVNFAPVRQLLDQARDAATQAKARVSAERYREVGPALEVARTALQKATQLLSRLTMNAK